MVPFVIGVFVGACAAVAIIGFIVATTEDPPKPTPPDRDLLGWYMEDDLK